MDKLEKTCKLRVTGYYQKNTSYLEEMNGSGNIDKLYELIEGNSITPFGYEIKIIRVNKYSVELIVNDKKVEVKEGDKICVAYKNETSGRNEDFRIDQEELYIELINVKEYLYPHLIGFIDNRDKIEENIKKVGILVKNKVSYSEIKNHLKTILYRLTSEEYLKKVNEDKVDFLIEERNLALPHKETIEELIKDIEVYFEECNKLFNVINKRNSLDSEEYKYLAPYLYQLAIEHTSYEHIPFEKVNALCLNVGWRNKEVLSININLLEKELIELCYLLMVINSKSREYFERFYIADELSNSLLNVDEKMFDYKTLINMHVGVGDYYLQIYNRPKAMKYYYLASQIAKRNGNLEESAYILMKYYRLNNCFPEEMKVSVDIEGIKKEYNEYADIIIKGINYRPLKVSKVEFDPLFINNYCFVMRKVNEEISKIGDLHIPYQRWDLMKQIYKEKYNIDWESPKEMNPRVMFD